MALHKDASIYLNKDTIDKKNMPRNPWRFAWPNTADFNFNYYKLLSDAGKNAIGRNTDESIRIAIIGAGIAGLTAARELFRSGYTQIDLYEASDRIGGRTYSIPVADGATTYEMGAMRMPFFPYPGSKNSVLDYYRGLYHIETQDFPNPGSHCADTGIYINQGFDPRGARGNPRMIMWPKHARYPENDLLKSIYQKWQRFAAMFINEARKHYMQDDSVWQSFWRRVILHYWKLNFRDLVHLPAISAYNHDNPGYFGGLGMNSLEANIFYTIGAGDGGWGAFYDISSLFPIRTLLFGYGTGQQLIKGRLKKSPITPALDSFHHTLHGSGFLGVQSFAEGMFYLPFEFEGSNISLHEACRGSQFKCNLYTRNTVNGIHKLADGRIQITSELTEKDPYDAVILSANTWAAQMSLHLEGFNEEQLPYAVTNSLKYSHAIASCKVFYPLKERYWEKSHIPQVISTDTLLQGVYGYAADTPARDPGVILLSYTWEDDAIKLLAEEDHELGRKCLETLDRILLRCENIGQKISPFVDSTTPMVIHWSKMPTYRGCAKLYRERSWEENYSLLTYNQQHSAFSGLYFAGEAYSLEGGWAEPALRGALDSVIHIIHNTRGTFLNDFRFTDYPRYDMNWIKHRLINDSFTLPDETNSGPDKINSGVEMV